MAHLEPWQRARKALLIVIAMLSLAVLLGPATWSRPIGFLMGPLALGYCVSSVYADRLQGQTLKDIYEDFRTGRRRPSSHWENAATLLFVVAVVVLSLRA